MSMKVRVNGDDNAAPSDNSPLAKRSDDIELAERGQALYDEQLKETLEPAHPGRFVAIEPGSGRYFLGGTGLEAMRAARGEMPDQLFYLVRIGHETAYRVGGYGGRNG